MNNCINCFREFIHRLLLDTPYSVSGIYIIFILNRIDSGSFLPFDKPNSFVPDEFSLSNIAVLIKAEETFSLKLESAIHGESCDNTLVNFDSSQCFLGVFV